MFSGVQKENNDMKRVKTFKASTPYYQKQSPRGVRRKRYSEKTPYFFVSKQFVSN